MSFCTPEERQLSRLNKESLEVVLREIARPEIARAEIKNTWYLVHDDPNNGAYIVNVQASDGKIEQLAIPVTVVSDGAYATVLKTTLRFAWQLSYLSSSRQRGPNWQQVAVHDGLQRDKSKLEAAGLDGWLLDPRRGVWTWDQILDSLKKSQVTNR